MALIVPRTQIAAKRWTIQVTIASAAPPAYSPLNSALRFSRNAEIPSCLSRVP